MLEGANQIEGETISERKLNDGEMDGLCSCGLKSCGGVVGHRSDLQVVLVAEYGLKAGTIDWAWIY